MLQIAESLAIPEEELTWKFARSGGPGGQNVNKVASKAILTWNQAANVSVPEPIKARFRQLFKRVVTTEGQVVISSQLTRDQDRNRQDCLEKLQEMLRQASIVPKKRKKTGPTRASRQRRLNAKKHRAKTKGMRSTVRDE